MALPSFTDFVSNLPGPTTLAVQSIIKKPMHSGPSVYNSPPETHCLPSPCLSESNGTLASEPFHQRGVTPTRRWPQPVQQALSPQSLASTGDDRMDLVDHNQSSCGKRSGEAVAAAKTHRDINMTQKKDYLRAMKVKVVKQAEHKINERNRRSGHKESCMELRSLVPGCGLRTTKAIVLQATVQHVKELHESATEIARITPGCDGGMPSNEVLWSALHHISSLHKALEDSFSLDDATLRRSIADLVKAW
ncbi:MAG: hypothetical protein M1825_003323 [Sarcosagium campestre]|nr:MAG: hypothetical protein M1825_003323 [Sarcosagium campestre]